MDNWKTLIKGLLIKERLKSRFDLQVSHNHLSVAIVGRLLKFEQRMKD